MSLMHKRLRKRPIAAPTNREIIKRLKCILKKDVETTTEDEKALLASHVSLIKDIKTRKKNQKLRETRLQEIEDDESIVMKQCKELAEVLRMSENAVVYTGAGISTSANIPDYRGSNGVWTNINDGKDLKLERSLTNASPTITHMCLSALIDAGLVKHIVSQNCDGLHLRSGVPPQKISEVHGNMYIEVCTKCSKLFHRNFDVTGNTALRRHQTDRTCTKCGEYLRDTIVHFGERSCLKWPHNWEGAIQNVKRADLILCLGSSLKVLRSYKQLWLMERPKSKRPPLYIVNLQWTPKDSNAVLKIHAKVDFVMENVAKNLGLSIPKYSQGFDPFLLSETKSASFDDHGSKDKPGQDSKIGDDVGEAKINCVKFDNGLTCFSFETASTSTPMYPTDVKECCGEISESRAKMGQLSGAEENVVVPAWFGKGLRPRKNSYKRKTRRRRKIL